MTRLRVATFNVWGLPSSGSQQLGRRMLAIGRALPALELDVLALQEVWTGAARRTLIAAGRSCGLDHAWHLDALFGGSGLLILSRFPIREVHFRPFRLTGLPQRVKHLDYYGGKGVARVVLETPDGEFELLNTHLHAAYGRRGFDDEYLGHRIAEVVELADEIVDSNRPVVLLGDLNAVENGDELPILLGLTGLRDAAIELDARQPTVVAGTAYQMNDDPPGARIDYALMREGRTQGLRPVGLERALDGDIEIEGSRGAFSDHVAVIADLELGGPGSPPAAPSTEAIAKARELLDFGRKVARERRSAQRRKAAAGGAVVAVAGIAYAQRSRRDWLRTLLGFATLAVAAPTLALGALSEGFTSGELEAYDEIESLLRALEERAAQRGGD